VRAQAHPRGRCTAVSGTQPRRWCRTRTGDGAVSNSPVGNDHQQGEKKQDRRRGETEPTKKTHTEHTATLRGRGGEERERKGESERTTNNKNSENGILVILGLF